MSGGDVERSGGVLASPEYASAFQKVMSGTDLSLLSEEERDVVRAARATAGVDGPGYPPPIPRSSE